MAIPRVAVYPSHMRKFDIPVRTFTDRDEPTAGYFEADLAAHNGGSTTGSRVHSLGAPIFLPAASNVWRL